MSKLKADLLRDLQIDAEGKRANIAFEREKMDRTSAENEKAFQRTQSESLRKEQSTEQQKIQELKY